VYLFLLAPGRLCFLVLFEQILAEIHYPANRWLRHWRDFYKIQPAFLRNFNRRFERHDTRLFTGGINYPNFSCLDFLIALDALWACDIPVLQPLANSAILQHSYRGTRIL
jgi:hypothetical protein